ncbi:50S ribosomal protein L1 [Candidatus Marinimicrobia bacterium MT.SAG.3]|nr:50S ribosomal protein L1 [Candidatus Marinimicrobia bacterium MT.SAG.3]
MKHSKRYNDSSKQVDRLREYSLSDAVALLKDMPATKFDQTVEVAINLGIDPKHADQQIRGTVSLPHGIGKTVKVLAITKGEKQKEAKDAGADVVGFEDILEKIGGGWSDIDVIVATPDVMGQLGKHGRILGPKGLMPNPKSGTVTNDIGKAVKELKAGRLEIRTDKFGAVHSAVGKLSFDNDMIAENIKSLVSTLMRMKPAVAKGVYFKNMTISSSMGPGIKVEKTSAGAK